MPAIIHTLGDLEGIREAWRSAGESVALVPTMGSLHEGHKALVAEAGTLADRVVVSIFVNPLQFGAGEDFEKYPRSLAEDEAFLADATVDIIFAPDVDVVYPEGPEVAPTLDAGAVGELYEGASRPGHFAGVLTVVKRLFDCVNPDVAVFGRKDAQQLFLIESMSNAMKLGIRIVEVGTVRDADGLALSSRNAYLSPTERDQARAIPEALETASHADNPREAVRVVRQALESAPGIVVDYVDAVDPDTFLPVFDSEMVQHAHLIVAANAGSVRLIDNRLLHFGQ